MDVIERRRANCPELGQIVRRYCVRIAVSWLCTSRIVVARASHYWPFFHHAIGDWDDFLPGCNIAQAYFVREGLPRDSGRGTPP